MRAVGGPPKQRRSDDAQTSNKTQQSNETRISNTTKTNQTWLEKLVTDIDLPSSQWVKQHQSDESIVICKLSTSTSPTTHSPSITHCVNISSDL